MSLSFFGCGRAACVLSIAMGVGLGSVVGHAAPPAVARPVVAAPAKVRPVAPSSAAAPAKAPADAGEAQWIWSSEQRRDSIPVGACFFRATVTAPNAERGQIEITCDDRYELFVNGQRVGGGSEWKKLDSYDITPHLLDGRNTIAVKAENTTGGTAGLVARVTIKRRGGADAAVLTNAAWRTSLQDVANWQKPGFDDSGWKPAVAWGELGRTAPWGDQVQAAGGASASRFKVQQNFRVERVADPAATGSLVAMAFNEFGELLVSREKGPLLLLQDKNGDGAPETVTTFSDQIKNCQGILALNGNVLAVGEGPDGVGFYKLHDADGNGQAEEIKLIFKFDAAMGEHGAHQPILGPDGQVYLVIGNHAHVAGAIAEGSPYHHYYEGDLVQPKYEDAGGHAVGVKAPGGTVIRTDEEGAKIEIVCGGFRNAYDIAFNRDGELFTCDSDMEWDEGAPWYRPVRVNHCQSGAEFGWRSGWSKWPDYYIDSLGATVELGRGSPTGVEFYNHRQFPLRYHNAMFIADWTMGRIVAVRMKAIGGGYEGASEVFVEGRPLNVTDLAVGPDGGLYFITGGRDTEGGVYRVVYTGAVPPQPPAKGLAAAIRHPQLYSAWGRNEIAALREQAGADWDKQIVALAFKPDATPEERVRALDLMQLLGPPPSPDLLTKLTSDPQPPVRAKAIYLLGLHADDAGKAKLEQLLADRDPHMQRLACEAIIRRGHRPPAAKVLPLLETPHRSVAWAARRLLETLPAEQWKQSVLSSKTPRTFLVGATALLIMDADKPTATEVLNGCGQWLKADLSFQDFADLLRVVQLALMKGQINGDDIPQLRQQIANEYPLRTDKNPAGARRINRELVRLGVYLQDPLIGGRMIEQLRGPEPLTERLHTAFHARYLKAGLSTEQKFELLRVYESARLLPSGHSFALYIDNFTRDFVAGLSDEERLAILTRGAELPGAAVHTLRKLPEKPSRELLSQLQKLDRQLVGNDKATAKQLQFGLIAILAGSGDAASMAYLREVFEKQPARRASAAMGLAQQPGGDNWPLLIRALPIVDGSSAEEVLGQLATVDRSPDKPEAYRQVILAGLRLGEKSGPKAIALLEKWTGQPQHDAGARWDVAIGAWQNWFSAQYPNEPEAKLPIESSQSKYTAQEVLKHLDGDQGKGDASRGQVVFEKAQCVKCHRYGPRGEGIGPDLTTVSQRFQRKEILESILFPSHVISDQYAAKIVATKDGRQIVGIVAPAGADAVTVLTDKADKVTIPKARIEQIAPSKISAMPENLLNTLTLEEIADLFAYLNQPPQTAQAPSAIRPAPPRK